MQSKRAGILVFDDAEVLDFCGPFEVLSIARLDEAARQTTSSPYEVLLVAENSEPVLAAGGLRVLPDCTTSDHPDFDLLIIPGGAGVRREVNNRALCNWIAGQAQQVETVAAVCTGTLLLAMSGALNGREATTHWDFLDLLEKNFAQVSVRRDQRVVQDGKFWTSAGVSAGIDLSLALLARDFGEDIARATARRMEYPYFSAAQQA